MDSSVAYESRDVTPKGKYAIRETNEDNGQSWCEELSKQSDLRESIRKQGECLHVCLTFMWKSLASSSLNQMYKNTFDVSACYLE